MFKRYLLCGLVAGYLGVDLGGGGGGGVRVFGTTGVGCFSYLLTLFIVFLVCYMLTAGPSCL